jgi:hypothetical protein
MEAPKTLVLPGNEEIALLAPALHTLPPVLLPLCPLEEWNFGNGALNDEVYGSNCGICPVFIHDLSYSP